MRPFGALAMELISIAEPMVRGVLTAEWKTVDHPPATSKSEILRQWDESSEADQVSEIVDEHPSIINFGSGHEAVVRLLLERAADGGHTAVLVS